MVQKGKFTKHYFEGSNRIVSKLGEGIFSHKNTGIMAEGLDYLKRTQKEQEARYRYIKGLNTPPGPPTQHGIYATPEWTEQPYPSIDWQSISQNQEPPEGWPRYPRFNEPGDVPGPPVQFGEPITNNNARAGFNFIPNGVEEKNLYFYHPDHLGSSSYITDREGQIIQHTEYMAFGEVLVDEHSTSNKMPYLFNGKELDYETGLYYYGARYYDAKTSIFLNVDPLVEKTGTPYAYTYNNPIRFIDPTGMKGEDWYQNNKTGNIEWKDTNKPIKGYTYLGKKNFLSVAGNGQSRRYDLNANGSVTEKTGDGKKTLSHIENGKTIETIGGITITTSKSSVSGMAVQGILNFTLGGGTSLSFGYVKDSYGDSSFYYTIGGNLGIGAGISLDFIPITTTDPNQNFRVKDFEGFGNSYEVGIGPISGSYGGTTKDRGLNASELFNPNKWGKKSRRSIYY